MHTKLGLAACIWIGIYATSINDSSAARSEGKRGMNWEKKLAVLAILIIAGGLSIGILTSLSRAPHIRGWFRGIQKYMLVDAEDMPVDKNGITPLLVDKGTTLTCLRILQKHKLSIFSHSQSQFKPGSELTNQSNLILGNYYDDCWISKKIKLKMNTGTKGHLVGKITLPDSRFTPNGIAVSIDGKSVFSQKIDNPGDYLFEANCAPNRDATVEIDMEKAVVPKELGMGEDQREISAVLREFYFQ